MNFILWTTTINLKNVIFSCKTSLLIELSLSRNVRKWRVFYNPYCIKYVQVTEEACSSQKRPSNTSKHEFFYFCGSFLPSWIRIRIPNTDPDPDPLARLKTDPIRIRNPAKINPKNWNTVSTFFSFERLSQLKVWRRKCRVSNSPPSPPASNWAWARGKDDPDASQWPAGCSPHWTAPAHTTASPAAQSSRCTPRHPTSSADGRQSPRRRGAQRPPRPRWARQWRAGRRTWWGRGPRRALQTAGGGRWSCEPRALHPGNNRGWLLNFHVAK